MKIKRLEICGFKSFVDRTVVTFPDPITAIVGPNGCGKSNIVDALRWCMGEQSAKHLRGRAMDDVIFAGSESRGPASMAEVSLTFDTTGLARDVAPGGVPWGEARPEEVVITRRLYRDGTSEYLLGNVPCRLRDVVDFFLGTGVGTKAYSIIEQGRVGFIVSSKPEDRRTLIDEAAGITKYKAKKRQAERRMESTRQHLLRVSDIIGELDTRLRSLRLQAQKAERYRRYKSELRELELWESSHRYLGYLAEEKTSKEEQETLQARHNEDVNRLAAEEAEVEAERLTLAGELAELSALREQILELSNQAQLENQRARHYEEEAARLIEQADTGRREAEELEARLAVNRASVAELEGALLRLQAEAAEAEARYHAEDAAYNELREALAEARRGLDEATSAAASLATAIARDEAALAASESRRAELLSRSENAARERSALEAACVAAERECASLESALAEVCGKHDAAMAAVTEAKQEAAALSEEIARSGVEIETLREEAHRRRSRLQSLQEIQSRYESFDRGVGAVMRHVQAVTEGVSSDIQAEVRDQDAAPTTDVVPAGASASWARPGSVRGPVAELVSAPPELETAVEAVLGHRLGGIVVESQDVGVSAVEFLKKKAEGRSTFIPLDVSVPVGSLVATGGTGGAGQVLFDAEVEGASETATSVPVWAVTSALAQEGVRGALIDLVRFDGEYRQIANYLLGDVLVVDGLDNALALWKRVRPRQTLVTLEGDVIEPHGVVTGGAGSEARTGVLSQRREIRELESILANLNADLAAATERHVAQKRGLAEIEARVANSEASRREAELARIGMERDLNGARRRLEDARLRLAQIDRNAEALRTQAEEAALSAEVLRTSLGELRERAETMRQSADERRARVDALGARMDVAVAALTELRVAAAQASERRNGAQLTLERTRREIAEQGERIARLERGGREQNERAERLRAEAALLYQAAAERLAQAEAQGREHADRQEAVEERSGHLARREDALRVLRHSVSETGDALARLQLRVREAEIRRASLEETVAERHRGTVLAEVVYDYHLRPPVGGTEIARMEELRGLIHRMGEINLTAIEESEELQKRYDFLTAQKADLEAAVEQLETAISKINRASRRRFQEVFDAVNSKFQEVFPRLFRGGSARLVLTNPEDMLETGVDIVANPPGKKMSQNLELLSGGEKALTAVSLLFAIFLVKPSPFCVLDEVDAPLDDVNVARFAQGITEMTQRSQFIIITHNKQTMEIADRLCGVTMEEPGVSKLVAVHLRGEKRGRASIETHESAAEQPSVYV